MQANKEVEEDWNADGNADGGGLMTDADTAALSGELDKLSVAKSIFGASGGAEGANGRPLLAESAPLSAEELVLCEQVATAAGAKGWPGFNSTATPEETKRRFVRG